MPLADSNIINQPRYLSPEELQDPLLVVRDFFLFASLPELRELHREAFYTLASDTWHQLPSADRDTQVCFFIHMERLIEACHLLLLREDEKKGKKV